MSAHNPAATILVVDDDASIRRFTCLLLQRITTDTVVEAATPNASLCFADTSPKPVRLLISDIDLHADIDGIELANRITARSPETRVVLMSGNEPAQSRIRPEWRFLSKPFAIRDLIDAVSSENGAGLLLACAPVLAP